MPEPCRICGSVPIPDTRFCRVCGALLNATGTTGTTGNAGTISPLARTVPLTTEGRPTDSISPEDAGYSGSDTGKVGAEEIERLLRHRATNPALEALENMPTAPGDRVNNSPGPNAAPVPALQETAHRAGTTVPQRRTWQLAALLLFVALSAVTLAYFYLRQTSSVDGATPISNSDKKKLVAGQLAHADVLLAAGDTDGAIEKLRYALKIDPTDAEAHRRLGLALEKKGQRREAIAEYRAAVEIDESNTAAWRALAAAQVSEGLYADAADSYSSIISNMNAADVDDNLRLEYADALRLAGRTDEARSLYQEVSFSESFDLARRAREQLAKPTEEVSEGDSNSNKARDPQVTESPQASNTPAASEQPPPVPLGEPAGERYSEKFYSEALKIVKGRDLKSLQRAELLRALQLFQNVKSGPHVAEANSYAAKLGQEYDRRRK